MRIALSAYAAGEEDGFLSVFIDLADDLACLKITRYSTQRHIQYDVFAALAEAECTTATLAVISENMLAIFQVKECPELFIPFEDNVASSSAIAAVRTTLADKFFPVEMRAACPTVP
jgi:hypothetical protein